MKELYIRTSAQKAALVEAIEHHLEVLGDEIAAECSGLVDREGLSFDISISQINAQKKEVAFLNSFLPALEAHPAGAGGVFLEAFEVGVLKAALASLVDVQDEDSDEAIYIVISSENIKNTIRSTAREWGAIDPERLAIELSRQAREALEGNSAAKDLLEQLK